MLLVLLVAGCGGGSEAPSSPLPAADLPGTRAAVGTTIDAGNADRLTPRWRFRLAAKPTPSGIFASTPVADGDTVYVQDLSSNVFALDRCGRAAALDAPLPGAERRAERARGRRRTRLRRDRLGRVRARRSDGPRALAPPSDERVGAVRRHRAGRLEGLVFMSTIGYRAVRPRRDLRARRGDRARCAGSSTRSRSRGATRSRPAAAGSGTRSRSTPTAACTRATRTRRLGRHAGAPERRRVPGPALYTDSLLVLDARTRPAALARPGDAARRPRLRLRGDADPRHGRRRRPRLRRRQGRAA